MSGTSLDISIEERAYHEAGHVVVAYLLRQHLPPLLWATIRGHQGEGGSCQFEDGVAKPPCFVAMAYAGAIAQAKFRLDDLPSESLTCRLMASTNGDCLAIHKLFSNNNITESDRKLHLDSGYEHAQLLIDKHWQLVEFIAGELMEQETLFYDEAFMILNVLANDDRKELYHALDQYRYERAPAPPPPEWNDRGPWSESFRSWIERKLGANEE